MTESGAALARFTRSRRRMVEEQLRARGIADERVLTAMAAVPRERFVDPALVEHAYRDKALPIGNRQTISQPFMVALMSAALDLHGSERVLEIGTGSGYQAAVLSRLAESVFTVERIPELARQARGRLEELGAFNVLVHVGDGTIGWSEYAPFDRILVTAGGPGVPRPLLEQLAVGGILVIPVGDDAEQTLLRVHRREDGYDEEDLGPCRFVKLVGRHGWGR